MNGPTQVPTPDAQLAAGCTESICIVALPVLRRGQPDGRESCIVLESGPTRRLVARLPQRSSLAIREFRSASKVRCEQCYGRVFAKL